jgi:glycosyltransferase involved in cell wall biosynthesis
MSDLRDHFDGVMMLTSSDWKTEPRSNRYHYASRLARVLPVLFVQPSYAFGEDITEPSELPGLTIVHAGPYYDAAQFERLESVFAARDIRRPLLWCYNVYFEKFVEKHANNFVCYHATEDYLHPSIDLQGLSDYESVAQPLKRLLRNVDFLLAVSPDVRDSYIQRGGYCGRSAVARNGCDDTFWKSRSAHEFLPSPSGRPVACYQGGINSRLDLPLLAGVIEQMSDWEFWFCGKVGQSGSLPDLLSRPNCRYLELLNPDEMAAALRHASVGIIPFVADSLMRISMPLKAFEYVASGLPVVASPTEALADRPDLFTLAATPDEFAQAIRRLAPSRTDPVEVERRLAAAAQESYDSKFESVSAQIVDALRLKRREIGRLNVAVIYDDRSSHVQTVAEHLNALKKYSEHQIFYLPGTGIFEGLGRHSPEPWDLSWFDVVIIHYCVRVSLDEHLNRTIAEAVRRFDGLKILFIQDEYDTTETSRRWIETLRIDVVFTCIPPEWVDYVYPAARFPRTKFVQTLTGYVPEHPNLEVFALPLRKRDIRIAYRGRDLPAFYGALGREKYTIGVEVKRRAQERNIPVDIEVDSAKRIYGADWYRFLGSGRATLGTESGSNIFDFDGSLQDIACRHRDLPYEEMHSRFFAQHEGPVQMNQISPRIFEAIRLRTALVLFEGKYSNVVVADVHYIPLKKDYSNIDDVFAKLEDFDLLESLTSRAYRDIVESGRYSYRSFVGEVDQLIKDMVRKPARAELVSIPILRRRVHQRDYRLVASDLRLGGLLNDSVLSGTATREAIMAACDTGLPGVGKDIFPAVAEVLGDARELAPVAVAVVGPSQDRGGALAMPALASPAIHVYPLVMRTGIRCARTLWRLLPRSIRVRFQPQIAAMRSLLRTRLSS